MTQIFQWDLEMPLRAAWLRIWIPALTLTVWLLLLETCWVDWLLLLTGRTHATSWEQGHEVVVKMPWSTFLGVISSSALSTGVPGTYLDLQSSRVWGGWGRERSVYGPGNCLFHILLTLQSPEGSNCLSALLSVRKNFVMCPDKNRQKHTRWKWNWDQLLVSSHQIYLLTCFSSSFSNHESAH